MADENTEQRTQAEQSTAALFSMQEEAHAAEIRRLNETHAAELAERDEIIRQLINNRNAPAPLADSAVADIAARLNKRNKRY